MSPHEADVLKVLIDNRSRATSIDMLIRKIYGACEPDSAATSLRVAVHSLRKKVLGTGIEIRTEPRVGYEVSFAAEPELNRHLSDTILTALNIALASDQTGIADHLQAALALTEKSRNAQLNHAATRQFEGANAIAA